MFKFEKGIRLITIVILNLYTFYTYLIASKGSDFSIRFKYARLDQYRGDLLCILLAAEEALFSLASSLQDLRSPDPSQHKLVAIHTKVVISSTHMASTRELIGRSLASFLQKLRIP